MSTHQKRNSILCPNCRKLITRGVESCPFCNIRNPSSPVKNNVFLRALSDSKSLLTLLISINVVMFTLSIIIDPRQSDLNFSPFQFLSPSHRSLLVLGSTGAIPIFQFERWWSLIAANYLHGGLLHILFNMLALRQLLPLMTHEFGSHRTFAIYTLGGMFGFFVSALAGIQYTIGASAALCSLIGALLYYGKSRGGSYGQAIFSQIGGWAIGIGIFGFLFPGINNWGHGGGMVAGILLGYLLGYRENKREARFHRLLSQICIAATVLTLLWSVLQVFLILLLQT